MLYGASLEFDFVLDSLIVTKDVHFRAHFSLSELLLNYW